MNKCELILHIIVLYLVLVHEELMAQAITVTKPLNKETLNENLDFSVHSMGRIFGKCFSSKEICKCLGTQLDYVLDLATKDNNTWQFGDFLSIIKKQSTYNETESYMQTLQQHSQRSLGDSIGLKLLRLAQMRSINLSFLGNGISNAIDDIDPLGFQEQGMPGRKKKDKDKNNPTIMGGALVAATLAQMFLGKVLLIAGSAFIMSKIALIVSVLSSLKKGTIGSSTSGPTEHIITVSGGHSHESGWHRSLPHDYTQSEQHIITEPHLGTSPGIEILSAEPDTIYISDAPYQSKKYNYFDKQSQIYDKQHLRQKTQGYL